MELYYGSPPEDMAPPASCASPGAGGSGGLPEVAAPHPLTGAGAARPPHDEADAEASVRPATTTPLVRPQEELDGYESDAESGGVPSTTASVASIEEEEEEENKADELRRVTLEVVARYLHENANAKAATAEGPAGGKGGEGGGTLLLQGLLGSPGAGHDLGPCVARSLETLRRVGDGLLDKHRLTFQGILRMMDIKNKEDLKDVSEVARHVFSDGLTNWGRIVTLISFAAVVAEHLKSINQESCINTVAEIITDVLVVDKREWLVSHNSWEGFINFFHEKDTEGSSIRNFLIAFAAAAGLGACLAHMIG